MIIVGERGDVKVYERHQGNISQVGAVDEFLILGIHSQLDGKLLVPTNAWFSLAWLILQIQHISNNI